MGVEISNSNREVVWLNCAKFVAIFAVMIDHTNGILYTNQEVAWASYFSVSLFILISGITSYKTRMRYMKWGGYNAI